jgi:hypothetical protein
MHDQTRMDYVLDRAQTEGRITASSRPDWAGRYLNDPANTEAWLAMLQPTPVGAGVTGHGDPIAATAAAGLALVGSPPAAAVGESREPVNAQHMRPVEAVSAVGVELTPENVKRWTCELFPETRAGIGEETKNRITRDQQYPRNVAV